ncbi:MAG: DMT family transporter [Chloroflexi bacterium]|nr:DMT family transporter [Chloroflexota bacterium]
MTASVAEADKVELMNRTDLLRGTFYGITAASIWGGMYVVSDVVLTVIPPFTLLSLRILLGLLALWPIFRRAGLSLPAPLVIRELLIVGLIGLGLSLGTQFLGTDLSTAVNGALVTSASPALVVLFAALLLKEKLTSRRALALVLASAGLLVILDPTSANFGGETFLGDVFLALSALTWGLYSVLVRRVSIRHRLHTLTITLVGLLGGLALSLPASIVELSTRPIGPLDAGALLGVAYLGIVSTALALLLWNRAFALVPATVASLFFFAQPVSGALLAAIFLGQTLTIQLGIGGALIAAGVLLSILASSTDANS